MKILCQRDPIWAKDKMGESNLTLGRFGCTTCCISMLSDYFKCFKSPIEIAHNSNNYTKNGLVLWKNITFDKMRWVRREYNYSKAAVDEALKNPNKACILQVDGFHWVVPMRKTITGKDYLIADPWTGKKVALKSVYNNITGASFYEAK